MLKSFQYYFSSNVPLFLLMYFIKYSDKINYKIKENMKKINKIGCDASNNFDVFSGSLKTDCHINILNFCGCIYRTSLIKVYQNWLIFFISDKKPFQF